MEFSLSRMSCWLFGKKKKDAPSNGSRKLRENDILTLSPGRWKVVKEKQFDDLLLIQPDGGAPSNGPDWSIGWVEPHGINFHGKDEEEDGFAVLVPCYKSNAIRNKNEELSNEGKNYMDWISSLQNC